MCHDGGATSLGYSRSRQRLFCGGKKGEVCVFDIRQFSLLQCLQLHSSTVNCIAMNDIDGYFVTGAADGEIKVDIGATYIDPLVVRDDLYLLRVGKGRRGRKLSIYIHGVPTILYLCLYEIQWSFSIEDH